VYLESAATLDDVLAASVLDKKMDPMLSGRLE
jgi:hypothetical protein